MRSTAHRSHSALTALDRAPVWLNSEPLTAEGLRGRVVAVDFWTYSCVNWLRTLPYVRAWSEAYRGRGLVVVGVHAPEFGFEHDLGNVRRAAADLGVCYPVVIDNDFAIWRSFENHYWPALYLVDGDGRLRFHHFGEGAYEETERAIQQLLDVDQQTVRVEAGGLAEAADWATLRSPETYLGYARGERRSDRGADGLALNDWALLDGWSVGEEAAVLDTGAGSIAYRFQARDLNLVLAPPPGAAVRFKVLLDGQPGEAGGMDVDHDGEGVVIEPRMYQLLRQRAAIAPRTFEITFLDPGARAYVFTFGYAAGPGEGPVTPRARPARSAATLTTAQPTEVPMSSTQQSSDPATEASGAAGVAMRFEVTTLPVADVDRAKAFYQRLGWRLDIDFEPAPGTRGVQFTPPGSPASIQFGKGSTTMTPPLQGMLLVVDDIDAAREDLIARGVEVSEVWHIEPGEGRVEGRDPQHRSYFDRATFADPDGNQWTLQEITERLPGRV